MSIQITVRSSSGTTQQTINGDGEIDTKTEAEDALAFAMNEGDTVDVGGKTYTRQQLIDIRDAGVSAGEPAVVSKNGVEIGGGNGFGVGKRAHSGGDLAMSYIRSLWNSDKAPVSLEGKAGAGIHHGSWNFTTPGGEDANSAYTRFGAKGGLSLHLNPEAAKKKLHFSLGASGALSGFSTPASTIVALPPTCTPDEFGQGECEPNAGPKEGNAGTTGLFNPSQENARGTNGLALSAGLPLTFGVTIGESNGTSFQLFGGAEPFYTHLYPTDGDGFGYWGINLGAGLRADFGKVIEAPVAAVSADAVSDGTTLDQTGNLTPAGAAFDVSPFFSGLPQGATVSRIEMTNDATKAVEAKVTSAPWVLPADKMTAGDHTIRIYYTLPGGAGEKFREVKVRVGAVAPIVVAPNDNGAAYGFILDMPPTASRLAPDVVAGVSTPRPIPLGNIQTLATFPDNAKYQLYVDGNPVGAATDLPKDRRTELTLPATVGDGPHQVELRILRPGQAEVRFPARAVNVGPSVATLTNVAVVTPPTTYKNDALRFNLMTTKATKAKVTIVDAKGRSTSLDVDIPATIPAGGLTVIPQGIAKTLPVKGLCTFSITPEGGTVTAVIGSVTINGMVPTAGKKATPAPVKNRSVQ